MIFLVVFISGCINNGELKIVIVIKIVRLEKESNVLVIISVLLNMVL